MLHVIKDTDAESLRNSAIQAAKKRILTQNSIGASHELDVTIIASHLVDELIDIKNSLVEVGGFSGKLLRSLTFGSYVYKFRNTDPDETLIDRETLKVAVEILVP